MRDPLVEAAFSGALSTFDGENFESLSLRARVLVAIWGIEAEVNNGGFDQYYFNGAGDQAPFAPEALRAIGANRMAAIAEHTNAVFGPAGPSPLRSLRQQQRTLVAPDGANPWENLTREFQAYPDDVYSLLGAFVRTVTE